MFVCGIAMGFGAVLTVAKAAATESDETPPHDSVDKLTVSIVQWSNIDSEVLLLVFLPGLIFRDAIKVNWQMFRASLSQILILAFPMVLVGTALTAAVVYYIIPYPWPLSLAATLGSILASTDPVAVGSILKTGGAPPRLQLLIAGESMLNDGSAVVLYAIFSHQYFASLGLAEAVTVGEGCLLFFRMSLGGIAIGIAFAAGLLLILYRLDLRLEPEYNILQVVAALTFAYLSYYVSEQVCGMSGVIACVVCGITARALGRGLINDPHMMDYYLALMEYLLNTHLFTLGGVVWGKVIAHGYVAAKIFNGVDWLYLLAQYVSVMIIRFIQVGLFYPIYSRIGLKSDWRESVFLAYGGLRGAVGIALALSLSGAVREVSQDADAVEVAQSLEFLAGGVTLLTLLIHAPTVGPLLRRLGLAKPVLSRKRALRRPKPLSIKNIRVYSRSIVFKTRASWLSRTMYPLSRRSHLTMKWIRASMKGQSLKSIIVALMVANSLPLTLLLLLPRPNATRDVHHSKALTLDMLQLFAIYQQTSVPRKC